ncbi:MAG TPA: twin-arginine translocase subunit TatC [Anaerolineae bacterium]|nr:twin-arginine translocase subunit TatC [Anaerolineae bacterium]
MTNNMTTAPQQDELTLLEHLEELRIRLTRVVISLIAGTAVSFLFAKRFLLFLKQHYPQELQTLGPTEGIETYFKVSLVLGASLAMPAILYQFWLFISPALEKKEKRLVYIFLPSAMGLFMTGILFAWFVLLPTAIAFLSTFLDDVFVAEWTSQEYISFVTTFLFWLGVSFEMPLIVYMLARLGFVTPQLLREQWRVAVVAIAIIAAVVTPSVDPITMLLTMVPLLILYVLSMFLARWGQRQFERAYQTSED